MSVLRKNNQFKNLLRSNIGKFINISLINNRLQSAAKEANPSPDEINTFKEFLNSKFLNPVINQTDPNKQTSNKQKLDELSKATEQEIKKYTENTYKTFVESITQINDVNDTEFYTDEIEKSSNDLIKDHVRYKYAILKKINEIEIEAQKINKESNALYDIISQKYSELSNYRLPQFLFIFKLDSQTFYKDWYSLPLSNESISISTGVIKDTANAALLRIENNKVLFDNTLSNANNIFTDVVFSEEFLKELKGYHENIEQYYSYILTDLKDLMLGVKDNDGYAYWIFELNKVNDQIKEALNGQKDVESRKIISDILKDDIPNEKFLKELEDYLIENKIKFEDTFSYVLSEVMQSITSEVLDSEELCNFLKTPSISSYITSGDSQGDSCKLKILTSLVEDKAPKALGILKNNDKRFGIKSQSDSVAGIYSLNELVYSNEQTTNTSNSCSMSHIMIMDTNLKASKRNELETSVFLNCLSTMELSKSTPYFNATFILPDAVLKGGKIYKTASITQFLNGTKKDAGPESKIEKLLNSQFDKEREEKGSKITYTGTKSNMSLFTSPQTLNNFNEVFVGRKSSVNKKIAEQNSEYVRQNNIHDITRPFMTIKSFNINVAPTQGLLSFKSGKLSLVIHDRTRMTEIAPFIKPDMFGRYGAEIVIDYGWSNISGNSEEINFVGDFIDSLKTREKYIITNSSFTMTKNGEVNVELSIAMKGPIDIKNTFLTNNSEIKINSNRIDNEIEKIVTIKKKIKGEHPSIEYKTSPEDEIDLLIGGKSPKEIIDENKSGAFNTLKQFITELSISEVASYKAKLRNVESLVNNEQPDFGIDKINSIYKELFFKVNNSIYKQLFLEGQDYSGFIGLNGQLGTNNIDKQDIKNLFSSYVNLYRYILEALDAALKRDNENTNFVDNKIINKIGIHDPFFDKKWRDDYRKLINDNKVFSVLSKNNKQKTTIDNECYFVSLGTFLASIIGVYLKDSNRYNDIQIISYCLNSNAGLMANKNISSLLIPQLELRNFIIDILNSRSKITLEGFISTVIQEFIVSEKQICYGLSDVTRPEYESVNRDETLLNIKNILHPEESGNTSQYNFIEFQMPKIKMMFDALTKRDIADSTILRITLYDENDNPYKELSDIFTQENKLIQAAIELNRSKVNGENSTEYITKQYQIYNQLIKDGTINSSNNEFEIKNKIKVKNEIKKLVPSVTYGTQNSGIIDANVTTINESNLNTVFMTRRDSDRVAQNSVKVSSDDNLPLQILPSKASITMFGCPFINFAQYLFLDFETGTTIDNFYSITGVDHSLSPGNFTTSLSLSYGDAYGKYFSSLNTIDSLIKQIADDQREYNFVENINTFEQFPNALNNSTKFKHYITNINNRDNLAHTQTSIINTYLKTIGYERELLPGLNRILPTPLKIDLNDKYEVVYTQTIYLNANNEDIGPGKTVNSFLYPTLAYPGDGTNDKTIIRLAHYIYRSENINSIKFIPSFTINLNDILNLVRLK